MTFLLKLGVWIRLKKGTILSGMRPTGALHFGNYFGALENWVGLQKDYDCHFMVADWHALTTGYEDTSNIKDNINNLVLDWIACGIDPEKSSIFVQSSVREHAELHLILSMITPLSWLTRCPTYKDQLIQIKDKNIATYGFLGYPCLQAADILIYEADTVPVGEDQLPHIELTREIARRFNYIYGKVLIEPNAKLTKTKVLPGLDGRKMSKTYNNTISLSESPLDIRNKVNMMKTDPERIRKDDLGHPEVCTVFSFHKIFNETHVCGIEEECKAGKIGCVACKKNLTTKVEEFINPIYERRQKLLEKPNLIREILEKGNQEAQEIAAATLEKIKAAVKI